MNGVIDRPIAVVASLMLVGCNAVFGINPPIAQDASIADDAGDAALADAADAACALALPDNPCALFPQCGCTGGAACVFNGADGTTACTTSVGTTPLYNVCDPSHLCPLGSDCVGNVCKPYCATDQDCPGPNRACVQITDNGDISGKPIPGVKACSSGCDLLNPSGICGPQTQCRAFNIGKNKFVADCVAPAGNAIGPGTCVNDQTACAPGYICVWTGPNAGACSKWCRFSQPGDCPQPLTCINWFPRVIIANVEWGSCN